MLRAITLGQLLSAKDRRQFTPERLLNFIKAIHVNSIIDLRSSSTCRNDASLYNSEKLKALLFTNGVDYYSWSDEISSLNVKLKGLKKTEFNETVFEELVKPIVHYLKVNPKLGYTALLFPFWEGENFVKGTFSLSIFEKFQDEFELNHMIPRNRSRGFDVFSNDDLYARGYGKFLTVREDMESRYRYEVAEFEDISDTGWDQHDIDHELRGMDEESGGSFGWNID